MPKTIYLDRLIRLTLTRKGKAVAKHPLLRQNVVEAVKATPVASSQFETTPLWETAKATPEETSKAKDAQSASQTPGLTRYASGRYQ